MSLGIAHLSQIMARRSWEVENGMDFFLSRYPIDITYREGTRLSNSHGPRFSVYILYHCFVPVQSCFCEKCPTVDDEPRDGESAQPGRERLARLDCARNTATCQDHRGEES